MAVASNPVDIRAVIINRRGMAELAVQAFDQGVWPLFQVLRAGGVSRTHSV